MFASTRLSVIIPTHNPDFDRLSRVFEALECQTLSRQEWELIVVDNASARGLECIVQRSRLSFPARVIREQRLGLTFARVAGFRAAVGELIVLCDDDNLLAPGYLAEAIAFSRAHPDVGAFGGKSLPLFEADPPAWFTKAAVPFGCRDRGEVEEIMRPGVPGRFSPITEYPTCAPIGAGMVLAREIASLYSTRVESGTTALPDRQGDELSAGGDCDIVLTAIGGGWAVAYTPHLLLTHIIPARRLELGYVSRLAREGNRSWVKTLALHGINSWSAIGKWTVPARKARAWLRLRAWRGPVEEIRWHGACGIFEARASLR